jgi:hypothetical protein
MAVVKGKILVDSDAQVEHHLCCVLGMWDEVDAGGGTAHFFC